MPLKYTKTVEIVGEHRDAVNAVVFSPSGQYLASAGHDGRILIWALDSGRALHRLTYHSPVLSLLWVGSPNQILAGCGNGRMLTISFDEYIIRVDSRHAHEKPVENFALNPCPGSQYQLASAAHEEAGLWSWSSASSWIWKRTLCMPVTSYDTKEHIITSLNWMNPPENDHLIISYLYHGVLCWSLTGHLPQVIWSIPMPLCGPTVISPNNQFIISNITATFKLFLISSLSEVYSVKNNTENPGKLLPLVLAHNGTMLVCGSTQGKPRLWRCQDGGYMQVLPLTEPGLPPMNVQAIAAHLAPNSERHLIVTATGQRGDFNKIQIWEAYELDS